MEEEGGGGGRSGRREEKRFSTLRITPQAPPLDPLRCCLDLLPISWPSSGRQRSINFPKWGESSPNGANKERCLCVVHL